MSDALYNPDQAALDTQTEPWSEAFRAQRDVGLLIPINYHTVPSVSLRAACFAHNQYEDSAFQKCFSNLLAVGLRSFRVDLYWDSGHSEWSLCPAEIPPSGSSVTASATASSRATSSTSNARLAREALISGTPLAGGSLGRKPRQDGSVSGHTPSTSSSSTPTDNVSSTLSESPSSTPSPSIDFTTISDSPLFEIGNYNCTSTITLGFLTSILEGFLDATATTTDAVLTFLVFNIHAASSWAAPNDPARQPSKDNLPAFGNRINDIIKGNLSQEIYTPQKLQSQRANLNDSWFDVEDDNRPASGYYKTTQGPSGQLMTADGWPTEAYVEFRELYRLIAGFGTIDPQMVEYNVTADEDTIFPPGYIPSNHNVTFGPSGSVSSGCLFAPSEQSITADTNSSWAVATAPVVSIGTNPDLLSRISTISNLTSCGLSFLVNSTVSNVTADQDPLPYAAFVHSYLWSWAPGEPFNATSDKDGSASTGNRCAAMYVSGTYAGRWQTVDCNSRFRVACQDPSTPYHWQVSSSSSTYSNADSACAHPFVFSVPHTALENAHLLAAIQASRSTRDDSTEPVFVDINSLDVANCWASSVNSTCPYVPPVDTNRTRVVVVPTVAAVIIFVCAALTFFVKCAANRREDKRGRRRRMVGGWEYEGVPT